MCVATYDVQVAKAQKWESGINVTAEFIDASEAKGCFVVVECKKSYFYQALTRDGNTAIGLVPILPVTDSDTCRVAIYDMEGDGLPNNNSIPAVLIKDVPFGQGKCHCSHS